MAFTGEGITIGGVELTPDLEAGLAIGLFTLFGILGAARHGIHETIDIAGSAGKKIAGHVRGN